MCIRDSGGAVVRGWRGPPDDPKYTPATLAALFVLRSRRFLQRSQERIRVYFLVVLDIAFVGKRQIGLPFQRLRREHDFVTTTEVFIELEEFQSIGRIEESESFG